MPAIDWTRLPPRPRESELANVVVETPAGSRNKFKFDETLGLFRLHKMLPVGAAFPFDFGFIPGTRADDGDPLDVMLLGEEGTFSGCVVPARILGVIEANQVDGRVTIRNDRLLGVPETAKIQPRFKTLKEIPAGLLDQIEHFFTAYNRFEGRDFVVLRRSGSSAAERTIDQGIRRHRTGARRR